jgi:hypothetical protein
MQLKNEEAPAAVGSSGEGGYEACTHDSTSRKPKRNHESEAAKLPRDKFVWRGLSLHLGRSRKPLLTVIPDATHPHLYRIKHPDGGRALRRISPGRTMPRMGMLAICWGRNARRGLLQPRT